MNLKQGKYTVKSGFFKNETQKKDGSLFQVFQPIAGLFLSGSVVIPADAEKTVSEPQHRKRRHDRSQQPGMFFRKFQKNRFPALEFRPVAVVFTSAGSRS